MEIIYLHKYSREEAKNNPKDLYVFTDTLKRSSGTAGLVDPSSWYYQAYVAGPIPRDIWYPWVTTSCVRGLPNAYPVTLQKSPWSTDLGYGGDRWEDSDFQEFKKVLSSELSRIKEALGSGQYHRVVLPWGGLLGREHSKITKDRCPECYQWLLREFVRTFLIS